MSYEARRSSSTNYRAGHELIASTVPFGFAHTFPVAFREGRLRNSAARTEGPELGGAIRPACYNAAHPAQRVLNDPPRGCAALSPKGMPLQGAKTRRSAIPQGDAKRYPHRGPQGARVRPLGVQRLLHSDSVRLGDPARGGAGPAGSP